MSQTLNRKNKSNCQVDLDCSEQQSATGPSKPLRTGAAKAVSNAKGANLLADSVQLHRKEFGARKATQPGGALVSTAGKLNWLAQQSGHVHPSQDSIDQSNSRNASKNRSKASTNLVLPTASISSSQNTTLQTQRSPRVNDDTGARQPAGGSSKEEVKGGAKRTSSRGLGSQRSVKS